MSKCAIMNPLPLAIIQTIIPYVLPTELCGFFLKDRLDFNMKFIYDASGYEMSPHELACLVHRFSNIVVIGVWLKYVVCSNIYSDVPLYPSFAGKYKYIKKIVITNCKSIQWDTRGSIDLAFLKQFSALTHLRVSGFFLKNSQILTECCNLKNLDLMGCQCDDPNGAKLFPSLRQLRKLATPGGMVKYDFTPFSLKECVRLTHLNLNGSGYMGGNMGPHGRLRWLKFSDPQVLSLPNLSVYSNLKFVGIDGCISLRGLCRLAKCGGLRHVSIAWCGYEIDVSFLLECKSVRVAEFYKCSRLQNVGSLSGWKGEVRMIECEEVKARIKSDYYVEVPNFEELSPDDYRFLNGELD